MGERPTGVTVLAILDIIGGVLVALLGLVFIALGPRLTIILKAEHLPPVLVAFFGVLGIVFIVIGAISIVIGWGLLKGKGWSWWLTVIFAVLGIIGAVLNIAMGNVGGIINLVIDGIIIYYMFRPHVKAYFGMY